MEYCADVAERKYQENLRAKGPDLKLGNDFALAEFIDSKIIIDHYSPGATLAFIQEQGLQFDTEICENTLYNYTYRGDVFMSLTKEHLLYKGERHKPKKDDNKRARLPKGETIENRPAEVKGREPFGYWEMDSIIGKQGSKAALVVLTERLTRYGFIPGAGPHHGERGQGPRPPRTEDGEGLPAGLQEYHRGQRQRIPGLRRNGAVPPPPDASDPNILLPPIQRLRAGEQREHEPDCPPLLPKGYQLRRSDSCPGRPGGGLDERLPQGHTWVAVRRGAFLRTPDQLNTGRTFARALWALAVFHAQARESGGKLAPGGQQKGPGIPAPFSQLKFFSIFSKLFLTLGPSPGLVCVGVQ